MNATGTILISLLFGFLAPVPRAQESVTERRNQAYRAAGQLDLTPEADPAWLELLIELRSALEDEDPTVRAFAARALQKVARHPNQDAFRLRVRELLAARLYRESSVFVRPWLERGLGAPRPHLVQRIKRAAAEPLLHRTSYRKSHPKGWRGLWADWMAACDRRELEGRVARGDGERNRGQIEQDMARSLRFVATLLQSHSHALIREADEGDPLAGQVLRRMDSHLRSQLEWTTDRIEEEGLLSDAMTWLALSRVYGIESFEEVVKPNFHHQAERGFDLSLFFKKDLAPAVIEGLVHGSLRERGQAMRLLKLMGPDAELAAPFVIHAWGGGSASVESPWLGFHLNLYDAIAGGGMETFTLVCEAMSDEHPGRRAHARKALTRFGGRMTIFAGQLEERRPGFWTRDPARPSSEGKSFAENTTQERRQDTWDRVGWILEEGNQGQESGYRFLLESRLADEDVVVRRLAAYRLGSLAASKRNLFAEPIRACLQERFESEEDPEVRYWLGIGCGYYSEERNPELDHLYYQTRIRQLSREFRQ